MLYWGKESRGLHICPLDVSFLVFVRLTVHLLDLDSPEHLTTHGASTCFGLLALAILVQRSFRVT